MSYDITIGEAMLESEWDDDGHSWAGWYAQLASHKDSPEAPNDPASGGNLRSPGYGQWHGFIDKAELKDWHEELFEGGHPGCVPLRPKHLHAVVVALIRWRHLHPGAVPGFHKTWDGPGEGEELYCGILARLIWLEWWIAWALLNCKRPAFANR